MTMLVVCLDGTNQTKNQAHPTNIARIFDTLGGTPAAADWSSFETTVAGPPAIVGKYLPGVGTQGDPVLKVLGNAFGDGIAEPIVRGYTFLSRNYNAGDEIIITGFSRGATAARALAGLVAKMGLLNKATYAPSDKTGAYLRAIGAWYAYRGDRDDLADQARLRVIGGAVGQEVPTLGPGDYVVAPAIRAVGVFDTVSSLGLPLLGFDGKPHFDFSICDTKLSDKVLNGFHALSADESRDLFCPTFWQARQNVVQEVFPGCHSDVGGGFKNRGLSDGALDWMLTHLKSVGLVCDAATLDPPLAKNALDLAQDDGAMFPFVLTPRSARAFPECASASDPLKARWSRDTEMLPSLSPKPYAARGAYADGRALYTPAAGAAP
jgi:uncharacterized protein (DUF2235 family)